MKVGSLSLKVYSWFCLNPDEELTATDIRNRWNVPQTSITSNLRYSVEGQLLTREVRNGLIFYSAGPELRKALECA